MASLTGSLVFGDKDVINQAQVERVAKLARLTLSEQEKVLYSQQLSAIISYFDALGLVDTDQVEPLAHPLPLTNVWRKDEVEVPPGQERSLAGAPASEKGYFRVPKITE